MAEHKISSGHMVPHDKDLEVSYGEPVPQPHMVKGESVAFGELAGSTTTAKPLTPKRNICFDDSITDNERNQPKSH